MGVAYCIVSQHEVDGFDPVEAVPDGKSAARASDQLEALAAAAGVRPLLEFASMDPEEAASMLGWVAPEDRDEDDPYPPPGEAEPHGPDFYPPEEWFDPRAGLATVQALIQAIEADPASLPATRQLGQAPIKREDVLADLRDFATALDRLVTANVRWHLAIDI